MSKQLGVGVRVFIGWTSRDDTEDDECAMVRCSTGTVLEGPFMPTQVFTLNGALCRNSTGNIMWGVHSDNGTKVVAGQHLLTPIDDDQETTESHEQLEQTA